MQPTTKDINDFQQTVWDYYDLHGRHELPWRHPEADGSFDAYKILVSEIMLQQTQVNRVIPKFLAFISTYPTVQALAQAPLSDVLTMWSGLGYNRRAKFLWEAAHALERSFAGTVPSTSKELVSLPGVGINTAGAILAYAHNQPVLFIETNVRTVFFHHFFHDQTDIPDKAVIPFIEQSMSQVNVREWYWALMDYGTYLKQSVGNLSRSSSHYVRQSTFSGSRRQIRGQVIRLLTGAPYLLARLEQEIPDSRLRSVLADLIQEGLIEENDSQYRLRA